MSKTLYPLQFQALFKYRMWGGNKLKTVLNKNYTEKNIGESWEISDVEGSETVVIRGKLQGYTLKQLITEYKSDFLGRQVFEKFGSSFPLLIKFIDAKTPLSVQVHPHDIIAKERHNSFGKNEMWYVMDADANAEIIVGFDKTTDRQAYIEALTKGRVLDLLNTVHAQKGDTFYIPTGRIHAIGAGVMLAEIQQTSDITYRVYDYDRIDQASGKKRELHNTLAIDVLDFEAHDNYKTKYSRDVNTSNTLVHSPYFKTNFLNIEGHLDRDYSNLDSFVILICTSGSAIIAYNNEKYHLSNGSTLLIPAALKVIGISTDTLSEIIEVHL